MECLIHPGDAPRALLKAFETIWFVFDPSETTYDPLEHTWNALKPPETLLKPLEHPWNAPEIHWTTSGTPMKPSAASLKPIDNP